MILDRRDPASATTIPIAQTIRRVVVIVIIVSFSLAALGGIIVLLGSINSEPASKVLATTALVGTFSVAVLCGAALIGKAWQWFGFITVVISIATLSFLLWQLWAEPPSDDLRWKLIFTLCLLSAATAVSSLLLLLVTHKLSAVRIGLFATLGMIALGSSLTLSMIWEAKFVNNQQFIQVLGITWILAALGIVVLPVVSLLNRSPNDKQTSGVPRGADLKAPPPFSRVDGQAEGESLGTKLQLSSDSLERIATAATVAGMTPDELIAKLIPSEPAATIPKSQEDA